MSDEEFLFEVGDKVVCSLFILHAQGVHVITSRSKLGQLSNWNCYKTDKYPDGINEIFLRKLTPLDELL